MARPLIHRVGAAARIVQLAHLHRAELQGWFDYNLGCQLRIERDHVRLFKVPGNLLRQGLDVPSARQMALFCLLLAAIDSCGSQTVISELAQKVEVITRTHPTLRAFDATLGSERRDLVHMVRLLTTHRVLLPTLDTSATKEGELGFIRGGGDALYEVDHRGAALLLNASLSPSSVSGPQELLDSEADPLVSRDLATRQLLMRRLVDDPVVYLDALPPDQREYFVANSRELAKSVRAGLDVRVEVRAEGAAIIDDTLTDLEFPKPSAASFAALLVAERLFEESVASTEADTAPWIGSTRALELCAEVAATLTHAMATINNKPVNAENIWQAVAPILIGLNLITNVRGGIRTHPAIARYRDPSARSIRASEPGLLLFGLDELTEPAAPVHQPEHESSE
ncbi:TIGR02678 family protein [Nocardia salmonicida]|uniref:TIGR02678 family protein n=1 Tax=Nocardia salmonicida TaxID=53431 RepID=UPI00366EBBAF